MRAVLKSGCMGSMGSHSITCHPTEVILTPLPQHITGNTPGYIASTHRSWRDERLS